MKSIVVDSFVHIWRDCIKTKRTSRTSVRVLLLVHRWSGHNKLQMCLHVVYMYWVTYIWRQKDWNIHTNLTMNLWRKYVYIVYNYYMIIEPVGRPRTWDPSIWRVTVSDFISYNNNDICVQKIYTYYTHMTFFSVLSFWRERLIIIIIIITLIRKILD